MLLKEKTAMMRVALDLVKADELIEENEIKILKNLQDVYGVTDRSILIESQNMSFSEAVNNLLTLPQNDVKEVIAQLEQLTVADGYCSPVEAVMLLAVKLCLERVSRKQSAVMSSNKLGAKVSSFTVVYVESDYDETINKVISDNYKAIYNEFRLSGFNFVYIPYVSSQYRILDEQFLKDVIKNIAPVLTDEKADKIYNRLCSLSTIEFCKEVLINKLSMSKLSDTAPALLVKIGDSSSTSAKVISEAYDNVENYVESVPEYLKIDIDKSDVMGSISRFIDKYKSLLRVEQVLLTNTKESAWFVYSGFNKTLFDMLAYPGQKIESRITVDLKNRNVLFADLDVDLDVPAQQRAIYVLLLFAAAKRKKLDITGRRERAALQRIYESVGKYDSDSGELDKNLSQNLSKIKKYIMGIKLLKNKSKYIPERNSVEIKVGVDTDKLYIKNRDGVVMPLCEYPDWDSLL